MPELHVIRHEIRSHRPTAGENYDPGSDMLIVVHKNPENPDAPGEWGHHMRLHGLAYRKEMWGLSEYSDVIDMELRDLERYYASDDSVEYGPHPLGAITEHYFNTPASRMKAFSPGYVMDRMAGAVPATTDGIMRYCVDTVLTGLEDVRGSLAGSRKLAFPCKGMTGLSADSVDTRSHTMKRMGDQTRRITLIPSKGIDDVRQYLTDRAAELDTVKDRFVNRALLEAQVPEIMRKRVIRTAAQRGLIEESVAAWM